MIKDRADVSYIQVGRVYHGAIPTLLIVHRRAKTSDVPISTSFWLNYRLQQGHS